MPLILFLIPFSCFSLAEAAADASTVEAVAAMTSVTPTREAFQWSIMVA